MTDEIIPHSWSTTLDCMVFVDDMILPNHYTIEVGFDTSAMNPTLHDIAFEKIEMFFEVLMNNSIIIEKDQFLTKSIKYQNNYIELPNMLNDQTLGSAIFSKLLALVGEDLIIAYVKISSNLGKNIRYTINIDSPEVHTLLPGRAEWWDDENIKFSPWWLRPDPATYDELLSGDAIYEGEFTWEEHFKEELEEVQKKDSKGKFQIIKGGKDGDK